MKQRIFISSVQKEFAEERQALKAYLLSDFLLSRFFEVFLLEDIPAADRRADSVYLEEVGRCDIYLALLGDDYGGQDAEGLSPTHREFNEATNLGKPEQAFAAVGGQVTGQVAGEVTGEVESQPESQPESRPESLEVRVLRLLTASPLSKAALSAGLGQKEISGQLNKVIRVLLGDQTIEYTIPDKPNSRMQRYRLTAKGKAILNARNEEGGMA